MRIVRKLVVYKRSPWKGYQIAKLNITTEFHKTTFKKFYKSVDAPAAITANKQMTIFTRSFAYVKYVRLYGWLIKEAAKLGLMR
jgi:hypothetical protein